MAKHIYLIAGHGNGDPGACGNGYQEQERVRALAQRIADLGGEYVHLHPFSDNAYKSGAISSLSIPKDWAIVELHMDSASASAKGGHVIIKDGFEADEYDKALAALMADIFPGRSQTIVGRSNLANVNRAAKRGYNYRLVENGFISNAGDVETFNSRLDDIARGYLAAFGIEAGEAPAETPAKQPESASGAASSATLTVDGLWGNDTTKALQKALGTTVDGIVSNQYASSKAKNPGLMASSWEWEANPGRGGSAMVKALQRKLGVTADGYFGPKTIRALQRYLGTTQDGCVSKPSAMVKALQKRLNAGAF